MLIRAVSPSSPARLSRSSARLGASAHTAPVTYWEQVAAHSRWGSYLTAAEERAVRRATRTAEGPRRALDIGCDGGRWAQLLAGLGWDIICTDVDPARVALCAQRLPHARVVQVDPSDRSLPCPDRSMSLVLCIEVVDVAASDWFANEAARVLSPGGKLVAVTWNRRSARGFAAAAIHGLRHGASHRFYRQSYGPWRRQLERAGFDVQHEQGMCWFPFGRGSNSPMVTLAVALESFLRLGRLPSLSPWVLVTARRRG